MAQRTILIIEDDLDGSSASETVSFSVQGVEYQLDLSDKNAAKFQKALDPYINAARRVGGRKKSNGSSRGGSASVDTASVRAWAQANGLHVSTRGRISADVLEQYKAAGN
jgi:hypothetical protein